MNKLAVTLASMLLFAAGGGAAVAHPGHDHGAPPPPISATVAPRADASTNDLELVAIARGDRLRIYLDRFRTNEPINGAKIEVDGPSGTIVATPEGDGVYVAAAAFLTRSGSHDLAFTVQVDDLLEVLTANFTIPEPPPAPSVQPGFLSMLVSSALARDLRGRVQRYDLSVWAAGAFGFVAGGIVVLLFVRRRRRAESVAVALLAVAIFSTAPEAVADPGHGPTNVDAVLRDVALRQPDGAVFVPKPTQRILAIRTIFTEVATHPGTVELPGRVIPDPGRSGFVQTSVSGRLAPPPNGFPRLGSRVQEGDVLAYVQPAVGAADVTSQQQQARELDQQISLVTRRLERLRPIANVIARSQIEDAELELRGLILRRANLERAPREPERLVAPVSGVVAAVQAVAGQIAEPNAIIFQIIDPGRFWIEALSFEAHSIEGQASGRLPDGRILSLAYRGTGLADRLQAIPTHFSVDGDARGLRAGQLLTVLATTQVERQGIAVPRASVLRGANGQSIVYQHTNAERFMPREVRVEPLDGNRVLIISGIDAGQRIVTQGAELLNQIR